MTNTDLDILAAKIADRISSSPRWLGTKQAATYARIGKTKLKTLAKAGKIRGYPDPDSKRGDWIFDKQSIDEYRLEPVMMSEMREKEILAKFKGLI